MFQIQENLFKVEIIYIVTVEDLYKEGDYE